jgi:hypothetical protein
MEFRLWKLSGNELFALHIISVRCIDKIIKNIKAEKPYEMNGLSKTEYDTKKGERLQEEPVFKDEGDASFVAFPMFMPEFIQERAYSCYRNDVKRCYLDIYHMQKRGKKNENDK